MSDYVILTDSCIDLTHELAEELGLKVVPLSLELEGKTYHNYLDERELKAKDLYAALRNKKRSVTSQVNPEEFHQILREYLEEGKDVLSISFSSSLSGTYNSSTIAASELREEFPKRKIITIDSLSASSGQGLLLTYASMLKKEGKTIDEVATWVEENRLRLSHLFIVDDLNNLKRGGRLSPVSAFLGTLLNVKPVLHVSNEGKLVAQSKARGKKAALTKLVERMVETIEEPEGQLIYISHGDALDDATTLKEMIKDKLPVGDIVINYVGPVIGSHSGPGTIAVFYLGNDRND